jgi:outer membrane protein
LLLTLVCTRVAAIDLLGVYELAFVSDPAFQGAGAANRATQEVRPQAKAQLLPNLTMSMGVAGNIRDVKQNSIFSSSGTLGTHKFNSTQFSLNLTQPVYRKDLWIALGQADNRIRQADAEYAFALQDLMLRASRRYFDVLGAQDSLTFARAALEAFGQQLKQSQQRFEVGLIAITDVEEARAGFDLATADVIAGENDLDVSREALREISGVYHPDLAGLSTRMPLVTPEPDDIDTWTEIALQQNLALAASLYAAEIARDEIRRVEAGHLPVLDIVGSHRRDDSGSLASRSTTRTEQTTLGLQLNLPIYQGGFTVSQTRESRHLYQLTLDEVERQRRASHRQTRDAYLGVISGISRVKALTQAVKSTESARTAIEAGFQVGTRTSVDVLDAEQTLFRAKRDLAVARYNYIIDTLTLKQAAGTLSEEDIRLVNAWLE